MEKQYCKGCRRDVAVRDTGCRLVCIYCGEWCREPARESD